MQQGVTSPRGQVGTSFSYRGEAGPDPQVSLGQCPEDVEDELPAAGRRVDGLPQAPEAHAAVAQIGDRLDEMLETAAEPVEIPDHERIAGPHVSKGTLQAGPLGLGPAGLVGIDLLAPC